MRDGALYARGADDNKGHLLLRIQAVEAHRAVLGELERARVAALPYDTAELNEHILFANYWRALRATARLYSAYATQE